MKCITLDKIFAFPLFRLFRPAHANLVVSFPFFLLLLSNIINFRALSAVSTTISIFLRCSVPFRNVLCNDYATPSNLCDFLPHVGMSRIETPDPNFNRRICTAVVTLQSHFAKAEIPPRRKSLRSRDRFPSRLNRSRARIWKKSQGSDCY